MTAIAYNDRVLAVGDTRSGKSELLAYFANRARVQRVLVDPKGEWRAQGHPAIRLRGVTADQAASEVEAIDWTAPVIHLRPAPGERHQLEAIYSRADRIAGPLLVWTDELMDVSTGNWEPRGLRALHTSGAARKHGALAATQRPLRCSMTARSTASHIMLSRDIMDDDLKELLGWVPFVRESPRPVAELVAGLDPYSFVWIDKRARAVRVLDPLSAAARRGGTFRKLPGFDTA